MSLQACAEIVRRGDPDRFLAAMAAPPGARRVLFPLYAFNVEVARAPWVTEEPMIAEMRLQWWRDALDEIARGGPVRRHDVVDALAGVLDGQGAGLLDRLIQARRWDIYRDPFEDDHHFDAYLEATAGGLAVAAARALGARDGEAAIRDVAWAGGLANWFLALPELEVRGRVPLVDGRAEAVAALAGQGLARLRRGKPPRRARAALLATWRARGILKRACRAPRRVADGTLGGSEFARRSGLILRSLGLA
ncbi:MAG: squalene/phytoene synthase family protein [Rhodobacter sp.]|nr:squalene/phytoene synthase family protein [Rhodobacter sp.]